MHIDSKLGMIVLGPYHYNDSEEVKVKEECGFCDGDTYIKTEHLVEPCPNCNTDCL